MAKQREESENARPADLAQALQDELAANRTLVEKVIAERAAKSQGTGPAR